MSAFLKRAAETAWRLGAGVGRSRDVERMPNAAADEPPRHAVTGMALRDELFTAVQTELAFLQTPASLGLIRVANFDQLASFDLDAAHRVLAVVGQRLEAAVGRAHPLAHVDRDCFAVWFGAETAPLAAEAQLKAIGYALSRDIVDQATTVTPDIQLGRAIYPLDADEPASLLNRAFVSLARPQRSASGGIAFFERPAPVEARRRFNLEQDLRHAVRRGEFQLHYQPIVDLAMGRVVGAEALLRWRDVSPAIVMPVLEECGLVHEIGLWTLNAAAKQLREWRASGAAQDLKIAVNLSALQLRDSALPAAFARTVASHGLEPRMIELELTETAAMEDAARTLCIFEQLREFGFSLAIDDFGSGYSSLSYLRRLPFQKLKIDREFVADVDTRADSRTICKALIDLTAGLEISVLAEGVERQQEVETLQRLGCATFQGFYFSRPLAGDDFIGTITSEAWLASVRSPVRRQQNELRNRLL